MEIFKSVEGHEFFGYSEKEKAAERLGDMQIARAVGKAANSFTSALLSRWALAVAAKLVRDR